MPALINSVWTKKCRIRRAFVAKIMQSLCVKRATVKTGVSTTVKSENVMSLSVMILDQNNKLTALLHTTASMLLCNRVLKALHEYKVMWNHANVGFAFIHSPTCCMLIVSLTLMRWTLLVSNDETFLNTRGNLVSAMGKFEPSPVSQLVRSLALTPHLSCTLTLYLSSHGKREKNIHHLICQCSQQWCEFNFTLFHFQVAPVVLPMTTATTATVTATTTLLLHIQTMRWPALRYTHHCITYTHTAMMALSHIYNMILTRKRKSLVLKSKTTKHLCRLTACFHCRN